MDEVKAPAAKAGTAGVAGDDSYGMANLSLALAPQGLEALRAERLAALNLMEDALLARQDLEKANAALRESEGRLRHLLESMDEAFVVKEAVMDRRGRVVDWRYVEWNAAFIRHTGIAAPVGQTMGQVFPAIEPVWIQRYAEVLRTGRPLRFQDRMAVLDRWLDVFASRVGGPESRRVALVFTDITERIKAEETLRGNEEQFRRAIEDAPIPVITVAEDSSVLQTSRAWRDATGYGAEQVAKFDVWLKQTAELDAARVAQQVRKLFQGAVPKVSVEFDIVTRRGARRRWAFSASAPGTLRDGRRYIVGMAVDITERVEELREANTELRALSRRLVGAQETERRKIAETLHDDVGQVLTALNLVLKRAKAASATPEIAEGERLVAELLQRVRSLSTNLRPHILDNLGLAVALEWHVKTFSEQTKLPVSLRLRGIDRNLPPDTVTTVFRTVQEALTNVARHSGAKEAAVRVVNRSNTIHVEVTDDGHGFDPEQLPADSSGLKNLRERLRMSGGGLEITSKKGEGAMLRAYLPLGEKQSSKPTPRKGESGARRGRSR